MQSFIEKKSHKTMKIRMRLSYKYKKTKMPPLSSSNCSLQMSLYEIHNYGYRKFLCIYILKCRKILEYTHLLYE